jgi:alpha-N-arabinofuranosidase
MKRLLSPTLIALLSGWTLSAAAPADTVVFRHFMYTGEDAVFTAPLPPGAYRNPILAGFYPDPSICRVGDDFYLINSSFAYFPGIPILHSRDLQHWRQIGNVIARPEQLKYDGLGVSRGIFAPAISHHGDTFYVVCTMVDSGGNFVVTAKNPAGPWSDPTWLPFEGIDPSIFFDGDGRAYIVNNGAPEGKPLYDGHRAIWIQEFDPAAKKMTGPRRVLVNGGVDLAQKPVWIEGPHLYRRAGWYYLCAAEGGTSDNHSQVIFRSKSLEGPFTPWAGNPILTQRDLDGTVPQAVTSTGHADLTIGPDGNWWAVFLGCRPFAGRYYSTGRETFLLPVTWTADGWPVILPKGERVPYVVAGPKVSPASVGTDAAGPLLPLTGNFTWRDDFNSPNLSSLWIMLRTPRETWWRVIPGTGLELTARAERLSGNGNPSFLARRLQHSRFSASTALDVPAGTGIVAGLAAFQAEKYHFLIAVHRTGAEAEVFLEQAKGGPETVLARAPLTGKSVELRITGHDNALTFEYAAAPGQWQTLAKTDAVTLTTQAAGGFVGATVGVHARTER